jgi:hypothetical protein
LLAFATQDFLFNLEFFEILNQKMWNTWNCCYQNYDEKPEVK